MTGQTSAGRLGSQKQAGRRRGEAGAGPQGSASGEPASRRPAERLRGRGAPRGHDADCKRGSAVVSSHQSCGPDAHGHLAFRCLLAGRQLPGACDGAKLGRGEAVAPTVADRHRRAGRLTAEMGDGPPALGRAAAAERHVVLGGSLGGEGPPPCPFPLTLSDRTPTARLSCLWPGDDKLAHSALDREAPCSPRHARAAAHRSSQ